ncbi:MAG: class I mannose-6-phosphate isomerase [Bacteroidales bacterium]|jgi:mannose-6-phosphate isomerase|nr:class I mannose-6-phosphate isomerase [Bacteroidales bacterium]
MLYPLKFKPLFFDKIWGGQKIKTELNLDFGSLPNCGEAWMLSGFDDNPSVVTNGYLKNNTLPEIIEIYMGDLLGEKVYSRFGQLFPLLIKWIDANDDLSVQVHPDDELAKEMYGNFLGKTEMWYIKQADKDAKLICGLKDGVSIQQYEENIANGRMLSLFKEYDVASGDVYYIPAGTVHALRSGLLLAEIQETSDLTFRIYDWDRVDEQGNSRQLHKDEALRAIKFKGTDGGRVRYASRENAANSMVHSPYFQTNYLTLNTSLARDFSETDSFVIYICCEGSGILQTQGSEAVSIAKGEVVLVPAIFDEIVITPCGEDGRISLLETYLT